MLTDIVRTILRNWPVALWRRQNLAIIAIAETFDSGGGGGVGPPGPPGASAYEVAVADGFIGDEAAWLASLVGEQGEQGVGTPGTNGDNGAPGLSAYEVAVAEGFVGDETAWLASLVGSNGSNGADGEGVPTGGTIGQLLANASATNFDTEWVDAPAGSGGVLILAFHADAGVAVTMTNQANSEQFLANSNRNITKIDLTGLTECRLLTRVVTGSASVNNPRLYLQYHTSFTTTVATYSDIGTSEVDTSMTTAGLIDSGWIPLVAGAKADVFVTVIQNGGDAAADPVVGMVIAHFR